MGTAISPVRPGTKVKLLLAPGDVSLQAGQSGQVSAMTRRTSAEAISITSNPDGSITVMPNADGSITASAPGGVACGGSINNVSTGNGGSSGSTPQPDEDYPYTVYVPSGTSVEFYNGRRLVRTTVVA